MPILGIVASKRRGAADQTDDTWWTVHTASPFDTALSWDDTNQWWSQPIAAGETTLKRFMLAPITTGPHANFMAGIEDSNITITYDLVGTSSSSIFLVSRHYTGTLIVAGDTSGIFYLTTNTDQTVTFDPNSVYPNDMDAFGWEMVQPQGDVSANIELRITNIEVVDYT